jgi:hypothetical protein
MFTVEIDGIAIATTNADEAQALEVFSSDGFKQDLRAMTSEGMPLWDGKAPLTVRSASPHEVDLFEFPDPNVDDLVDETESEGVFVSFLILIDHDHEETLAVPLQLRGSRVRKPPTVLELQPGSSQSGPAVIRARAGRREDARSARKEPPRPSG